MSKRTNPVIGSIDYTKAALLRFLQDIAAPIAPYPRSKWKKTPRSKYFIGVCASHFLVIIRKLSDKAPFVTQAPRMPWRVEFVDRPGLSPVFIFFVQNLDPGSNNRFEPKITLDINHLVVDDLIDKPFLVELRRCYGIQSPRVKHADFYDDPKRLLTPGI